MPAKFLQTATVSTIANSQAATTLFALNGNARFRTIVNQAASALLVKFGAGAAAGSYTVSIAAGGYYELPQPLYAGVVTGIWPTADAAGAQVTEY